MKLLNLAVVLLISPLIDALANQDGNDIDVNSSLLEPPVHSRHSKRADDICIKYCTSPESVQNGICLENRCQPARECVNIQGWSVTNPELITNVMANITLADDVVCGVWTALDCQEDGQDSFARICETTADLKTKMKAYAKSYRCYRVDKKRRSVNDQLEHEVAGKQVTTGITAGRFMSAEKETSTSAPCINIQWSNTPDREQYGTDFNACIVPLICYTVNTPFPGGLASIHFDDGFACDLWTISGCIDLGGKSHVFLDSPSSDVYNLLHEGVNDGRARSFACRANPPHNTSHAPEDQKNSTVTGKKAFKAVETLEEKPLSVEALVNGPISDSKLTSRAELGTCIDHCSGPHFDGNCNRGHCTDYNACTNVWEGMGSIGLGGATTVTCLVYTLADCQASEGRPWTTVKNSTENLQHWTAFMGVSFRCGREARLENSEPVAAISEREDLTARAELGTCVDHCSEHDFKGKCTRNHCTAYAECVSVPEGVDSISFRGSTECALYTSTDCVQLGGRGKVLASKTVTWVTHWAMWADKAYSFRCGRPNKRSLSSVDAKRGSAVSNVKKRETGAVRICVDYFTGEYFSGDAYRNYCFDGDQDIPVSSWGGIRSMIFQEGIHCTFYRHYNCHTRNANDNDGIRFEETTLQIQLGTTMEAAYCFNCGETHEKRAVREVESTAAAVAARKVEKRVYEIGCCVDHCTGSDFSGTCTLHHCTIANECVTGVEVNSIRFVGDTYCTVYLFDDCKVPYTGSSIFIGQTWKDINAGAVGWGDNKAKSFKCALPIYTHREKRAVQAVGVGKRQFEHVYGTCVDWCKTSSVEDAGCTRNHCTDANICVTPPNGFDAIAFGGDGYCLIFPTESCREDDSNLTFTVHETSNDLSAISGWMGSKPKPKSFMCARYRRKRDGQTVEDEMRGESGA